jgi:aryl-alcohol dehydrogenase-like predicted oxidoreductase
VRTVSAAGIEVSAIGLGTWQFGSREWGYGKSYAAGDAIEITHRALDLGVNLIDTAEIYGFGESERIVGRAIAERREDAFVATKVFPAMPIAPVVVNRGKASRDRLRIATIDLYQVHWPNPIVPDSTAMNGLRTLRDEGVIRHAGVSNYPLTRWQSAEKSYGMPLISNQVQYSLVARKPDRDVVPWAQAHDHIVIAYSPLGQGFLSARYDATNAPGGIRAGNALFLPENLARGTQLLEALRSVAKAHDATPAQVALAWVIRRPNVVAIPGASSVEQLERNVEAADLDLTDDEDQELTAASDAFQPVTGLAAMPQLLRRRLPF